MEDKGVWILDVEILNLFVEMLDFSFFLYKLKENVKLWCVVLRNVYINEVRIVVKGEISK